MGVPGIKTVPKMETDIFREKTTMAVDVTDCFALGLYGISLVSHPSRTAGWMRKRIWGGQLFPDLKGQHFQHYM